MIVIANVLPKLQTVNILVRPLSKKCRLGTLFYSEHVKASLKPCEMSMRALHSCFSSFSGKLIWKIPPLVLCETLGLSVNTLTSDGKYPVQGCENLQLQFECNYLKNEKLFLAFLFHFWILHQIWNTSKEKIIVIANVFPNLQTVKIFVRKLSLKSTVPGQTLAVNMWKRCKCLLNFRESPFIMFVYHSQWSWFGKSLP